MSSSSESHGIYDMNGAVRELRVKTGDTVRILRARNAFGTDVYSFSSKPYGVGETFVVGRVIDNGYPCKVAFPEDGGNDFWRVDDLEVVTALSPSPTITGEAVAFPTAITKDMVEQAWVTYVDASMSPSISNLEAMRAVLETVAALASPPPVAVTESMVEAALSFNDLRLANEARQAHWGGTDNWTLSDWSNAVAGEVGEACNIVKKIRRTELGTTGNSEDVSAYYPKLEAEIGDILIYLDLLAKKTGTTLERAVSRAFNEKSDALGMPVRLTAALNGRTEQ